MECVVNREHLLPALGRVIGVVERRQTLPILGNLLLTVRGEAVELVGTDLEVEVRTRCEAQVQNEGEITLPARKLMDICRNLVEGSDVKFRLTGERCTVTSGRSRFALGVLPAGDFPLMEPEADSSSFTVRETVLTRILDKTAFAMAQQDVRYYLNGVLIEFSTAHLIGVATDGHRLAKFQAESTVDMAAARQVIVPSKTVQELRKQLAASDDPATIALGDKSIRIVLGVLTMTSKLVDGRYPEYDRVIPRELSKQATVGRDHLKRALSRTAILSNEKYRGVRLTFDAGVLKLQAHNPEQEEAEEEIEMDYDGPATSIGFNVSYLTDVLSVLDNDSVRIAFEDANSSSVWRGLDAPDETYVVMPMRL